ncbi:hypothetical protein [Vibrio coralliilyticus]|uniref:Uncharacterized protein n=1 Tax=Vibrio coralliilyticus TaxID=190893 RepID=A0AAP7DEJ8_9VIBR|nr:hypothetical protein [Vibrio coralliilyticus]NOI31810.1 hypothetical protein [Vibrio coralliilyticus]NOJ25253.1 hypothetical protein [Vibrio coralliilyticus]
MKNLIKFSNVTFLCLAIGIIGGLGVATFSDGLERIQASYYTTAIVWAVIICFFVRFIELKKGRKVRSEVLTERVGIATISVFVVPCSFSILFTDSHAKQLLVEHPHLGNTITLIMFISIIMIPLFGETTNRK